MGIAARRRDTARGRREDPPPQSTAVPPARSDPLARAAVARLGAAGTLVGDTPRAAATGLRSAIGNRALARYLSRTAPTQIHRAPLTPDEQAQDLANEPYASNTRLQQAYDNAPLLSLGESGDAVALVQQGLIDDGILLPNSTANGTAPPDGIFGSETLAAVREFQQRHGLDVDGIVGRQTMGQLDQLAAGHATRPPATEGPEDIYEGLPEIATGMGVDALLGALEAAPEATLERLARNTAFVTGLSSALSPADLGRVVARLCLRLPGNVQHPAESRQEAERLMSAMLGANSDVALRASGRLRAVVIPADRLLTEIPPFTRLGGEQASLGRPAEMARGVTIVEGDLSYSALPEENLLGIRCTAVYVATSGEKAGIPQTPGSEGEGTSIAVHELGHGIENTVLTDADLAVVQQAFSARTRQSNAHPDDPDQWVDGRKDCYASLSEGEFFTQLSAAYLGTNAGYDRTTHDRRHNDKEWVATHEPTVYAILERIYAGTGIAGTNPTTEPLASQEHRIPTIEEILARSA